MEGQFTEPSGVAVNAQGDIVVADTNNHRIQVFDKEGASSSSLANVANEMGSCYILTGWL